MPHLKQSSLVRLAYVCPNLRGHLLPIITGSNREQSSQKRINKYAPKIVGDMYIFGGWSGDLEELEEVATKFDERNVLQGIKSWIEEHRREDPPKPTTPIRVRPDYIPGIFQDIYQKERWEILRDIEFAAKEIGPIRAVPIRSLRGIAKRVVTILDRAYWGA